MVIELSTDLIFLGIVICFALAGAKKGGILSVGGLIAMVLSWILSKMFAMPIAAYLFTNYDLDSKMSGFTNIIQSGIAENANMLVPDMKINTLNNFFGISNKFSNMINGIVNQSALNICSIFISILLFGVFMMLFGLILRAMQKLIEQIPMGKTANSLLGLICGALKGLILAAIIYMLFYCLNLFFHTNIPINETYIGQLLNIVNQIHF